ncbi:DUF6792 domain-containing protein [Alkalicoccobacillus porphyridii]|uniref:DUF6792 domain-containing protein n=1 Tax=Alkalicoccobacillus porphyridii TaxID=2597270 RepID=A0A554A4B1_9BACI|nr:DUF6792 domain-containing protein [Alkalicoccobacillus porphyridii]TSB48527.1 hypothetical protein FN960_02955 [Alkalicoccobacillus porphyridii]
MGQSQLDTDIRNELTALQYENAESGIVFDQESVYEILEHHGVKGISKEDIQIYKSDGTQIKQSIGEHSGFDGAAVHIHNEDASMNDVYFIYRGTEFSTDNLEDVVYDAFGVVGGSSTEQVDDALTFYREVKKEIQEVTDNELTIYGDGHSLGGHLIVSTALIEKEFNDVRGINDAPVHFDQLVRLDPEFGRYANRMSKDGVLHASEEELLSLAQTFYSEESKVITHERMKGEPLYAQTIPNTAYLGRKINYYGDPHAAEFPNLYEAPKPLGIFHNLHPQLMMYDFMYDQTLNHLTHSLGRAGETYTVAEANAFLTSAYHYATIMPMNQKVALGATGITGGSMAFLSNPLFAVKGYEVISSMDQMDLHSMNAFIEAYSRVDRPVLVQYTEPGTGKRIFVNVDKLLQVRDTLKRALEEKGQALKRLKGYTEEEISDLASSHKNRFRVEMSDKEASWRAFLASEGKTYRESDLYKPTGITFRRDFENIDDSVHEPLLDMIEVYQAEFHQLEKLYNSFESNLHELFEVDEELSRQISS